MSLTNWSLQHSACNLKAWTLRKAIDVFQLNKWDLVEETVKNYIVSNYDGVFSRCNLPLLATRSLVVLSSSGCKVTIPIALSSLGFTTELRMSQPDWQLGVLLVPFDSAHASTTKVLTGVFSCLSGLEDLSVVLSLVLRFCALTRPGISCPDPSTGNCAWTQQMLSTLSAFRGVTNVIIPG